MKGKKRPSAGGNQRPLSRSLHDHLTFDLAKDMYSATPRDKYHSVVLSVRERLAGQWIETQQRYYDRNSKRLYYLSLEFLLGRLLSDYVINLGLTDDYRLAVEALGLAYEDIERLEWDAGLGNGGLGRLAACFLDSLATLEYPGYGYGIRYEFGIFSQKVSDGYQMEAPDNWLRYGNPWEFPRPELLYPVKFYGRVNTVTGGNGRFRMEWANGEQVMAMAYDYPIPGFRNNTVNTLRLWSAKATREFRFDYFNSGDYIKALEDKNQTETISKVLYPNDQSFAGRELRLKQQYFFVCATLRDILRRFRKHNGAFETLPDKVAIQLNDTHPSIAIAELMRILVDEERLHWDDAWKITTATFRYTNHTVLPEALETWPEGLLRSLLPRHHQIIEEIDRRFLIQVEERFPDNREIRGSVAIMTGDADRTVHMSRFAVVGSRYVNGVSALHTEILKETVFRPFFEMMPDKFRNVTNGVTPRRWLLHANPGLAGLITEAIGDGWQKDLGSLRQLEPYASDSSFRDRFLAVKTECKKSLTSHLYESIHRPFDISFMLDCQIKRFHEYKRQLLNLLHVITIYNRLKDGRTQGDVIPRVVLFAGKAAPGYFICKLIIKLIHSVADVVDADPAVRERLKVIFVPNYGVTLAQQIIPAADISEQISTAGFEASGTGNMKFALNGAVTIGTLDGANVEILREVGRENFFLFGHHAEEIRHMQAAYDPKKQVLDNPELGLVIDQLASGHFSPMDRNLFRPIVDSLLGHDRFFVLADYASYVSCQEEVGKAYQDRDRWAGMAIMNVARSGRFSSDRAIREYADTLWDLKPVPR